MFIKVTFWAFFSTVSSIGAAQTEHADNLYKNLDPTNPVFVKTVIAKSEAS